MAEVRVVTDSSCDLPAELATELGVDIVPLTIRFGNEATPPVWAAMISRQRHAMRDTEFLLDVLTRRMARCSRAHGSRLFP